MSEIKVDTLKGKTSAGDVDITSEGGAVTMQLQQGLAKTWVNLNGNGTIAIRDSLNVASLTDEGTGAYQTNLTTNMGNSNYAVTGSAGDSGGATGCWHTTGFNLNGYNTGNQTGSFHAQIYYATNQIADIDFVYSALHGDLA